MPYKNILPCHPVIKWVGGKRQLLPELKSRIPLYFKTYYEPFFGGGALFFALQPQQSLLNDINSQLINMYQQIKDNPKQLMEILDSLQDAYNSLKTDEARAQLYKRIRKTFNEVISQNNYSVHSAALFIFLNKTCFNGLYRVNSKGEFNSPPNYNQSVSLYGSANISNVSRCLKSATILNQDFEDVCTTVKEGDLVFFDPPYYDTFDSYQAGKFSEQDHRRLAALFSSLTERGAYCMLTNSNTEFIHKLYTDFTVETVDVRRSINRDGARRSGQEVIITNYKQRK